MSAFGMKKPDTDLFRAAAAPIPAFRMPTGMHCDNCGYEYREGDTDCCEAQMGRSSCGECCVKGSPEDIG